MKKAIAAFDNFFSETSLLYMRRFRTQLKMSANENQWPNSLYAGLKISLGHW